MPDGLPDSSEELGVLVKIEGEADKIGPGEEEGATLREESFVRPLKTAHERGDIPLQAELIAHFLREHHPNLIPGICLSLKERFPELARKAVIRALAGSSGMDEKELDEIINPTFFPQLMETLKIEQLRATRKPHATRMMVQREVRLKLRSQPGPFNVAASPPRGRASVASRFRAGTQELSYLDRGVVREGQSAGVNRLSEELLSMHHKNLSRAVRLAKSSLLEHMPALADQLARILTQNCPGTLTDIARQAKALNYDMAASILLENLKALGMDIEKIFVGLNVPFLLRALREYAEKMDSRALPKPIHFGDPHVRTEAPKKDLEEKAFKLKCYLLDNSREKVMELLNRFIAAGKGRMGARSIAIAVSKLFKEREVGGELSHFDWSEPELLEFAFEAMVPLRSALAKLLRDPKILKDSTLTGEIILRRAGEISQLGQEG